MANQHRGMPSMSSRAQVYQIDFTAVASGKTIASTKRRVRWRFGFANPEALANGETGTACRGEEHDVTLVWSITSGKRLVLADGQEIHFSKSRSSIFDYSWTMRGNHVLKIVAHATPSFSATPNFRQYDFFVDGQSFFTFPKVYRLGLDPRAAAASPTYDGTAHVAERGRRYKSREDIAALEAPHNPEEEEAYLQAAIRQSLEDDKPSGAKASSTDAVDLLDLNEGVSQALPALPAPPLLQQQTTDSFPVGGPDYASWGSTQIVPAAQTSTYAAQYQLPTAAQSPWGSTPTTESPFAASSSASMVAALAVPSTSPVAPLPWAPVPPIQTVPFTSTDGPWAAPVASITPQAQATPSTLGFASPSFFVESTPNLPVVSNITSEPSSTSFAPTGEFETEPQAEPMLDQAFSQLVNLGSSFAEKTSPQSNPFETSPTASMSLAALQAQTSNTLSQPGTAKEIMSNPSYPLPLAPTDIGGYTQQQPPPSAMPNSFGIQAVQNGAYGYPQQQQQQQPLYGQPPPARGYYNY